MINLLSNSLKGFLFGLLLTTGCGQLSHDSKIESANMTFAEWCGNWNLSCGQVQVVDVPERGAAYTPEQWKKVVRIFGAYLNSKSSLEIDRNLVLNPTLLQELRRLAAEVGLSDMLETLITNVENGSFVKVVKASNSNVLEIYPGSQDFTSSTIGLQIGAIAQTDVIRIKVVGDEIAISGLQVKVSGKQENLERVSFDLANHFNWSGPNLTVKNVPFSLLPQLVGLNLNFNVTAMPSNILTSVVAGMELLPLLKANVDLGTEFFDLTRNSLDLLNLPSIPAEVRSSSAVILGRIQSLKSSHDANGAVKGMSFAFTGKTKCQLSGASVGFVINENFGVTEFSAQGTDVLLKMQGMTVDMFLNPVISSLLVKENSVAVTAAGFFQEFAFDQNSKITCK